MSKARGRTLADRRFRFTSEDRWGYFFIFVAMVVFVTFTLYPVVSAVRTSFLKYKPFGSEFIGLKNYIDTFKSALFYKAVKNTIVYTAVVVPLSLLIAFSIAIMILPFKKKTQSLFKSVYYLPGIASGVALSVVWLWLYDSSPDGLFNQVLMFFGIPSQNWLSSSKTSMLSLMLMAILSGQGSNIIIYIAALLGIDNSYFEAAELDGAVYYFDPTWDLQDDESEAALPDYLGHTWFALTAERMAVRHTAEDPTLWPDSRANADNYYVRNGYTAAEASVAAAAAAVRSQWEDGRAVLEFRCESPEVYDEMRALLFDRDRLWDVYRALGSRVASSGYQCVDDQQIIRLIP